MLHCMSDEALVGQTCTPHPGSEASIASQVDSTNTGIKSTTTCLVQARVRQSEPTAQSLSRIYKFPPRGSHSYSPFALPNIPCNNLQSRLPIPPQKTCRNPPLTPAGQRIPAPLAPASPSAAPLPAAGPGKARAPLGLRLHTSGLGPPSCLSPRMLRAISG